MADINDMSKSFKDTAELKAYSEAQHRTIIELNRRINALETENGDLRRKVSSIDLEARKEEDNSLRADITDEMAICEMQLSILRDRSLEGELTLEESKKVEIFTKLLIQLKDPKKKEADPVKQADTTDLLKLIEGGLADGPVK